MKKFYISVLISCLGLMPVVAYAEVGQSVSQAAPAATQNSQSEQAGDLFESARKAAAAGQKDTAIQFLSQALAVANNITDNVLKDQVRSQIGKQYAVLGEYNKALEITQSMGYETMPPNTCCISLRTEAEVAIAKAYLKAKQYEQALKFAQSLNSEAAKEQVLVPIVTELAVIGRYPQAIETAKNIKDDSSRNRALFAVAQVYSKAGQYNQALNVISNIQDNVFKADAQRQVVETALAAGQYDQALQLSQKITIPGTKVESLRVVANAYAKVGQKQKALQVLSQAFQLAKNIEGFNNSQWAGAFAEIGAGERALAILQTVKEEYQQAETRISIARGLLASGQYAKALEVAKPIPDRILMPLPEYEDPKVEVLRTIAQNAIKIGNYDLALQAVQATNQGDKKVIALQTMAKVALEKGQKGKAGEFLTQAVNIAKTIDKVLLYAERGSLNVIASNARLLKDIALDWDKLGQREQALNVLSQALQSALTEENAAKSSFGVDPAVVKAETLREMALAYNSLGQKDKAAEVLEQALQVSQTVKDKYQQIGTLSQAAKIYAIDLGQKPVAEKILAQALALTQNNLPSENQTLKMFGLRQIAEGLAAVGQREQVQQILSQITALVPANAQQSQRNETIRQVATAYAQAGQTQAALELTNTIEDKRVRFSTLSQIAAALGNAGQKSQGQEVLSQALQVANTLWDEGGQESLLMDLVRRYSQAEYLVDATPLYDMAMQAATAVASPFSRTWRYSDIALAAAKTGDKQQANLALSKALEASQAIDNKIERQNQLLQFLDDSIRAEQYDLALQVAGAIQETPYKIAALRQLAYKYATVGQKPTATQVLSQASQVAQSLPNGTDKSRLIAEITQQQRDLTK